MIAIPESFLIHWCDEQSGSLDLLQQRLCVLVTRKLHGQITANALGYRSPQQELLNVFGLLIENIASHVLRNVFQATGEGIDKTVASLWVPQRQ